MLELRSLWPGRLLQCKEVFSLFLPRSRSRACGALGRAGPTWEPPPPWGPGVL